MIQIFIYGSSHNVKIHWDLTCPSVSFDQWETSNWRNSDIDDPPKANSFPTGRLVQIRTQLIILLSTIWRSFQSVLPRLTVNHWPSNWCLTFQDIFKSSLDSPVILIILNGPAEIISCVPETFCTSWVNNVQFALISAQSYPTST